MPRFVVTFVDAAGRQDKAPPVEIRLRAMCKRALRFWQLKVHAIHEDRPEEEQLRHRGAKDLTRIKGWRRRTNHRELRPLTEEG